MPAGLRQSFRFRLLPFLCVVFEIGGSLLWSPTSCRAAAQEKHFAQKNQEPKNQEPLSRQDTADDPTKSSPNLQTSQEWNHRLKELLDSYSAVLPAGPQDYRI